MRRPILLLLVLLLPACTSWQPVAMPAPESGGWSVAGRLRVTTHWGTRIQGDSAWIAGDTLMLRAVAESTISVAASRIAVLERHGFDRGRTIGLGIGASMLALLGVLMKDFELIDFSGLGGLGSP
jgi:hypothetical protein